MTWRYRIRIKHLFVEEEDYESVQGAMNAVADVLEKEPCFVGFRSNINKFREIPEGDAFFGPVDYANKLLDAMYDFADRERIWVE